MQNLKKALAIVLAVAMVFTSVNVPGAYAADTEGSKDNPIEILAGTTDLNGSDVETFYNVPASAVTASSPVTVSGDVSLNITALGTYDVSKGFTVNEDSILRLTGTGTLTGKIINNGLIILPKGVEAKNFSNTVEGEGVIQDDNGLYDNKKNDLNKITINAQNATLHLVSEGPIGKIFNNGLRLLNGALYYDGKTEDAKFEIISGTEGAVIKSVTATSPKGTINPKGKVYTLKSENLTSDNDLTVALKYKDLTENEGYTIDYSAETITSASGYEIVEAATGTELSSVDFKSHANLIKITKYIDDTEKENAVFVHKKATDGVEASDTVKIATYPKRPKAPQDSILVSFEETGDTITGNIAAGQSMEYKCEGEGISYPMWQVSPDFENLIPNKKYTFSMRKAKTKSTFASKESSKKVTYVTPKVTIKNTEKIYNGKNQIPGKEDISVTWNGEPLDEETYVIKYSKSSEGSDISKNVESDFINVGNYSVVISEKEDFRKSDDEYVVKRNVIPFNINPKVVANPAICLTSDAFKHTGKDLKATIEEAVQVYDNSKDKTAEHKIPAESYQLSFAKYTGTDLGKYDLKTITENGKYSVQVTDKKEENNYNITGTAAIDFTVAEDIKTPDISVELFGESGTGTYNGKAQYPHDDTLSITGLESLGANTDYSVSYSSDEFGATEINPEDIKNAGDYYVVVKDKKPEDENTILTKSAKFNIKPATLTLTGVQSKAINKVYDGSNAVDNIKIEIVSGLINPESAELYGKGTLAQAAVDNDLTFTYDENGFEFRNPKEGFIAENYNFEKPKSVEGCEITEAKLTSELSDKSVDAEIKKSKTEEQSYALTGFGSLPEIAKGGKWSVTSFQSETLKSAKIADNTVKFQLTEDAKIGDKATVTLSYKADNFAAKEITLTITVVEDYKPSPIIPEIKPEPEKPVVSEVKPDIEKPALPKEPPKSGANIGMDQAQQEETDKIIDDIVNSIVKPADPEKPAPIPQTEAEKETAKTEAAITEAAKNNEKVKINVESKPVKKEAVKEDAKKIEEKLSDSFGEQKVEILQFANIDVVAEATDKDGKTRGLGNLRNIEKPLAFTFQLPENTTGKYFGVARIHDGIVELLPAEDVSYDPITKKITFKTDKFSTYAVYETEEPQVKPEPPVDPEKPNVPEKPEKPAKPGIVKNVKVATDFGLLKITYNKSENVDGYKIAVRRENSAWRYINVKGNSRMITKLYNKNLVKNGKYQVKVAAVVDGIRGDYTKIKTVYANRIGTKASKMIAPKINKIKLYYGKVTVYANNVKYKTAPKNVQYKVSYKLKGAKKWNSAGYSANNVKVMKGLKIGKTYNIALRYRYKSALDGKTYVYSKVVYKLKTVW